ncbi:hypothetical protein NE237_000042 [Protea cynaroides]|uniref:Uncharacterized protein n=1 Tax=Protea cynaroides TaxID=273540 RepID=A0A9Q0JRY0_9MAGN|nr:hypothetical protein NE237_000042 [Protea cynaroides]
MGRSFKRFTKKTPRVSLEGSGEFIRLRGKAERGFIKKTIARREVRKAGENGCQEVRRRAQQQQKEKESDLRLLHQIGKRSKKKRKEIPVTVNQHYGGCMQNRINDLPEDKKPVSLDF